MTVEFKPWPKVTRLNNARVVVTEKIDGTNACVIIDEGKVVGAQSRKRLITPDQDNMGFADWVARNEECLEQLGDGYHFGEWAGPGVQKNRHNLPYKTFFLFNTRRWAEEKPNCCSVVPVLYEGVYYDELREEMLQHLIETREYEPEGIVMYFPQTDHMWKYTLENREGKWKA